MTVDRPPARRGAWRGPLIVLTVVVVGGLALAGLAVAGFLVFLLVAMGSYGSNK